MRKEIDGGPRGPDFEERPEEDQIPESGGRNSRLFRAERFTACV